MSVTYFDFVSNFRRHNLAAAIVITTILSGLGLLLVRPSITQQVSRQSDQPHIETDASNIAQNVLHYQHPADTFAFDYPLTFRVKTTDEDEVAHLVDASGSIALTVAKQLPYDPNGSLTSIEAKIQSAFDYAISSTATSPYTDIEMSTEGPTEVTIGQQSAKPLQALKYSVHYSSAEKQGTDVWLYIKAALPSVFSEESYLVLYYPMENEQAVAPVLNSFRLSSPVTASASSFNLGAYGVKVSSAYATAFIQERFDPAKWAPNGYCMTPLGETIECQLLVHEDPNNETVGGLVLSYPGQFGFLQANGPGCYRETTDIIKLGATEFSVTNFYTNDHQVTYDQAKAGRGENPYDCSRVSINDANYSHSRGCTNDQLCLWRDRSVDTKTFEMLLSGLDVQKLAASNNLNLQITATNTRLVKLYFHDQTLDPNYEMCGVNNSVERAVPITNTPIKDTLQTLLNSGLIPQHPDFRLESLNLESDGALRIRFSVVPSFTSGGSCAMSLMADPIAQTMKQFPEVKQVIFEPYEMFQP